MLYDGIIADVVASGIKGGRFSNGSTVASASTGTGDGAAGADFLLFFFLGFLPPDIAAPPPARQQQHKPTRKIHSQIGNCEPKEPEAFDPELSELPDPEEALAQDPRLKDPDESPEEVSPGPEPREPNDAED